MCIDRLTRYMPRIRSYATRLTLPMAAYVATWRCKYGLWMPLKVRKYGRSTAPAPAGMAMDLALAITTVLPCPFVHTMAWDGWPHR